MVNICVCGGCSNSSLSGHRVHRFPSRKNPAFWSWVRFVQVRRQDFTGKSVSNNSVVCSAHFCDDDYNESDLYQHKMGFRCRDKVRLKLTAVPSVHGTGQEEKDTERGRRTTASTTMAASPFCSCSDSKASRGAAALKLEVAGMMANVTPDTADHHLGPDVMEDCPSAHHHQQTTADLTTQHGFGELVSYRSADVQQMVLIEETTPEEWRPGVDQQDPESVHIKEEEGELWSSLEEEQLGVKEETDDTGFSFTEVPLKSEDDEEKPLLLQLHQHQMEVRDLPVSNLADQMKAATREDCEGAETTMYPVVNTHEEDSDSSETEDSDDYKEDEGVNDSDSHLKHSSDTGSKPADNDYAWMESGTPESGFNTVNDSSSCSECGKRFNNGSFLRHVTSHSRTKSSGCFAKKKSSRVKKNVESQKKVHKTQKSFSCDICGKKFSRKDNLNTHTRFHTGEKPFDCEVCGQRFAQKTNLVTHMRFHTGEKPFHCDICGQRFTQKTNLVTHKRIHTGEKPFACDLCGQRFNQKSGLNSHMSTHTSQTTFACDVCGQRFCHRGHLNSHMRIHTGEKLFDCDICEQKFSQKSSLNAHMTIHTGQKPFSCDVCGQMFRQKNTLDKHTRIHTGQKPFVCDVCGQMFRQRAHLDNHMRVHIRNNSDCVKTLDYQSTFKNIDMNKEQHPGMEPGS